MQRIRNDEHPVNSLISIFASAGIRPRIFPPVEICVGGLCFRRAFSKDLGECLTSITVNRNPMPLRPFKSTSYQGGCSFGGTCRPTLPFRQHLLLGFLAWLLLLEISFLIFRLFLMCGCVYILFLFSHHYETEAGLYRGWCSWQRTHLGFPAAHTHVYIYLQDILAHCWRNLLINFLRLMCAHNESPISEISFWLSHRRLWTVNSNDVRGWSLVAKAHSFVSCIQSLNHWYIESFVHLFIFADK